MERFLCNGFVIKTGLKKQVFACLQAGWYRLKRLRFISVNNRPSTYNLDTNYFKISNFGEVILNGDSLCYRLVEEVYGSK